MTAERRLPFLFEIGTDELPARFLPVEREHVTRELARRLDEHALDHAGLQVLATPRRLAVLIDDLRVRQDDREIEIKGPPVSVAYGDDGSPTKAAEGFARKNGIDLAEAYEIVDEKGGRFLGARKTIEGREAAEVLAEILPPLLLATPFPKTMRWGTSDLEYARPVQWLVALLGEEIVPVELAGRTAGRVTRGHRTLADNREIEIPAPGAYRELLRGRGVIVDQAQRSDMILEGIEAALAGSGGRLIADPDLLDEVVDLCEFPTAFAGRYDEAFFVLPSEVIVTALKSHQRYFAVRREDGDGLMPLFAAVRDGDDTALDNVVRGNQRVLVARLSDAVFYWDFDRKRSPDGHVERLADVTWLEGYGSLLDKTVRVEALTRWLWAEGLKLGDDVPPALARAARLCKFDLITEMIRDGKEFTKLEGVIGARYAAAAGEPDEVCALLETYPRPRGAGEAPPEDARSAVLSMADRLDTLAGCWLAGFIPTGAKDPYALRRHVLAIQRTLMAHDMRLDLVAALARALEAYADRAEAPAVAEALAGLDEFAAARLERLLSETDASLDAVRAVLPVHGRDPVDTRDWAQALDGYREHSGFLSLATGFKRCRNILEGRILDGEAAAGCASRWREGGRTPEGGDFSALVEPAETDLRDRVAAAAPSLEEARAAGDYRKVFEILSALGPAIDAFFDTVRVNVDDLRMRQNRHGFLREIYGLFAQYADFSAVAPLDSDSS